jgi:hypothetical protein
VTEDRLEAASFVVEGWSGRSCWVLISGLKTKPSVITVRQADAAIESQAHFEPDLRLLTVPVAGSARIELRY